MDNKIMNIQYISDLVLLPNLSLNLYVDMKCMHVWSIKQFFIHIFTYSVF